MTIDPNISIKCLIVDDEPPAREVIKRYIGQIPFLKLEGECANAIEAITCLQRQTVNLLFLDIRMPRLSGTDFLKTLKNPPKIILTTAFTEYAVEGYELDVVDYLLKPIRFERFLKAINKAFPLLGQPVLIEKAAAQINEKPPSFVYFRAERKMVKVLLKDILFVESMKDYVKIKTTGSVVITKQSISSVEKMLPEKLFIRTHRSYIVSLLQIRSFTPEMIELGNNRIPVGKLYRNAVMKTLGQT